MFTENICTKMLPGWWVDPGDRVRVIRDTLNSIMGFLKLQSLADIQYFQYYSILYWPRYFKCVFYCVLLKLLNMDPDSFVLVITYIISTRNFSSFIFSFFFTGFISCMCVFSSLLHYCIMSCIFNLWHYKKKFKLQLLYIIISLYRFDCYKYTNKIVT